MNTVYILFGVDFYSGEDIVLAVYDNSDAANADKATWEQKYARDLEAVRTKFYGSHYTWQNFFILEFAVHNEPLGAIKIGR